MADYRDPKVTTAGGRSSRGMGTWIGVAIAALVVLALIWWWWGAGDEVEVVEPVAPAVEGTVTEEPATEGTATETPAEGTTEQPAAPAQQ